jgi:hypothetical protein
MQNLDQVIKLVNKMLVTERVWSTKESHNHEQIINHTLEQQGVQKVLDLLNKINDGDQNLKDVMQNL